MKTTRTGIRETSLSFKSSRLSWRSILAGLAVSILTYAVLLSLGFAVGGLSLAALSLDGITGFSIGAGIWLAVSAILSIFAGAYLSSRLTFSSSRRVGAMQGLTTAAVFLIAMVMQFGAGVAYVGSGAGRLMTASWESSQVVLNQPQVQQAIEEVVRDVELERPVDEVIQGVAIRAFQGRFEDAQSYLAANSNLDMAATRVRMAQFETRFDSALAEAQDRIGAVMASFGWISFFTLLLGAIAGALGGALAARSNLRSPLSYEVDEESRHDVRLAG